MRRNVRKLVNVLMIAVALGVSGPSVILAQGQQWIRIEIRRQTPGQWRGSFYYELVGNRWVRQGCAYFDGRTRYYHGTGVELPRGNHWYALSGRTWYMLHQGRWRPVQFYFPQRAPATYPQPRMSDHQVNQKLMEGYIGNLSAIQSMNMISNAQMSITSTIFK